MKLQDPQSLKYIFHRFFTEVDNPCASSNSFRKGINSHEVYVIPPFFGNPSEVEPNFGC